MIENQKLTNTKDIKRGSNRSFGIIFSIFFLFLNLLLFYFHKEISISLVSISIFFLIFALFKPRYLSILNKLWFKFGLFLGKFSTPVIISIIYILSIAPFGIIFRIFRIDFINQNYNKKDKTYWITKKNNIGSYNNQF